MKPLALGLAVLALGFASPAAAQLATTKLYNHVDTPITVTYSASGEAQVVLDAGNAIIQAAGYHKISVRVGATHATSFMINMGKISNATLSQMFSRPTVPGRIYTFDVIGPEFVLWLRGGPPNTTEQVQLWVFLST